VGNKTSQKRKRVWKLKEYSKADKVNTVEDTYQLRLMVHVFL